MLRTALLALFRLRDRYLLSNCLAILSNLGPHVAHMHAYTSERIVTIIEKLGKRIIDTEIKYVRRCRPRSATVSSQNGVHGGKTSPALNFEPITAASVATYIDIMQDMQDTLCVVLTLVCRAIRFYFAVNFSYE